MGKKPPSKTRVVGRWTTELKRKRIQSKEEKAKANRKKERKKLPCYSLFSGSKRLPAGLFRINYLHLAFCTCSLPYYVVIALWSSSPNRPRWIKITSFTMLLRSTYLTYDQSRQHLYSIPYRTIPYHTYQRAAVRADSWCTFINSLVRLWRTHNPAR